MTARSLAHRAFTLVEILIVVVILGILAALVVPQFATAAVKSRVVATEDQLEKLRRAIEVYYVKNQSQYPALTESPDLEEAWAVLINGEYFKPSFVPSNQMVDHEFRRRIVFGSGPADPSFGEAGWIYDNDPTSPTYGRVWAVRFDENDQPYTAP